MMKFDSIKTEVSKLPYILIYLQSLFRQIVNLGAKLSDSLKSTANKISTTFARRGEWWQHYNFSQFCYFLAILILIYQLYAYSDIHIVMPALIAMIGLMRELLSVFHRIWSFNFGKAIILVTYASTANIALAFAAMQINQITGVEPSPFIFTLGFTTVVLLPFWITITSTVLFSLGLIVAYAWLIVRLPLRLLGFNAAIHWEDKKHPFLTMIARILLIPVVMTGMFQVSYPFFEFSFGELNYKYLPSNVNLSEQKEKHIQQLKDLTQYVENQADDNSKEGIQRLKELTKLVEVKQTSAEEQLVQATDASILPDELYQAIMSEKQPQDDEKQNEGTIQKEDKALYISRLIAYFIFYFEAYPNSACMKEPEQRSVILDENLALMITPDETMTNQYRYEVVVCQPRLTDLTPKQND